MSIVFSIMLVHCRDGAALQQGLDNLSSWSVASGLAFNDKKCKLQTITRKPKPICTSYEVNGNTIKSSSAGATRSSVPCLQNCCILRKRYCFRSSINPSGLISDGSADSGGKIVQFFKSIKDCSGELLNSLK